MPTVIALDVSLSMRRVVSTSGANDYVQNEQLTRHHLAVHGINALLHYLQVNSKLEFVALVSLICVFSISRKIYLFVTTSSDCVFINV